MIHIWRQATISGITVTADGVGTSWVRFMSTSFLHNDGGDDYGYLGVGIQVIQ